MFGTIQARKNKRTSDRSNINNWLAAPVPSANYGSDTWAVTLTLLRQARTYELKQLRRLFKFKWYDEKETYLKDSADIIDEKRSKRALSHGPSRVLVREGLTLIPEPAFASPKLPNNSPSPFEVIAERHTVGKREQGHPRTIIESPCFTGNTPLK